MKATHVFLAMIILATLVSCGQSNKQSTANNEIEQLENELKNIDPKAKGGNTCLLAYAEKYTELLTKDMVVEATGADPDKMETHEDNIGNKTKYNSTKYSWETGETAEQYGMNLPVHHGVTITGIEPISLEMFQLSYRAVSENESRKIQEDMNEALDGNTENSVVNQAIDKLDEMGFSKEEQQKMVKDLTESAQKMTEGFTKVDKIGDAATWNAKTNTLYVFKDGAMFELIVDLKDKERNLEVAKKLAQQVLAKCK